MPNAGMPENIGGHAHYHLTPEELTQNLSHFVKDLGVSMSWAAVAVQRNQHIRQLVQAVGSCIPKKRSYEFIPSASSLYQSAPFRIDNPPTLIGERTNANGSKLFRDFLAKEDWESSRCDGTRAGEGKRAYA
jgi:5-methyltetrahydrofolate--homocysteine methyltransferase